MIDGAMYPQPLPRAGTVAAGCAILAGLCGLLPIIGWAVDAPILTEFGVSGFPMWPLTAIGYIFTALGFLALIRGDSAVAVLLWIVPFAITAVALIERLTGWNPGFDRLLFPRRMALITDAPAPGRPGINTVIILSILLCAGAIALSRRASSRELASIIGSCAVALGGAGIVVVLVSVPGDPVARVFASSMPASLAAALLGAGFVVWAGDFTWMRVLASNRAEWRLIRLMLPAAILLPAAPSLIAYWSREGSPFAGPSGLVVPLFNMTIIALLLYWAMSRIARQQVERQQFSEALETAVVAIVTTDGAVLHWSRGCEELYGWSQAEALGHNKYALLHSRCQQYWSEWPPFQTSAEAQELVELRKDGSEVAVLERAHRVRNFGGRSVLVLNLSDVTRGSEAIAALRRSEERLAEATAAYELGVFEWDIPSGRFDWSPGTEARLGLEAGAMPDFEHWRALVEPDDVQTSLDTIARTVAQRADKFNYRYRFRQPHGSARMVEGSARTFYDEHGNLVRAVGVIIDVTEREEREAALRQREAQLRTVLETVPDAMVVVDDSGSIREFSKAAEQLWHYRAADVIGRRFTMLAPESDRGKYLAALEAYQHNPHGAMRYVGRVTTVTGETADGRRIPLEARAGMARTDNNTLFTIFFRDISEQLVAEERWSDLNAELAHVSRQSAMSELAADLAHELNQPLSATSNFLAAARMLLEKGEEPERAIELVRMGGEQTLRAGEIIRRLRAFMAKREVEMRAESVEQTVRDAVELVLVGTGQFDIRVSYELDDEIPLMFADRIQVQQVLVNLLRNATDALRATERDRREITIASRSGAEGMIEIEVRDTGPGLPDSVLKQLYTRFVTTKSQGGMGIGLSISRRIIEAHGGTLVAENRAEGGACFRFTIPAIQQEELA